MEDEKGETPKKIVEVNHIEKTNFNSGRKLKAQPWIISTVILAAVIMVILLGGFGSITGGAIGVASKADVETKILDFVKAQTGETVEIVNSGYENGLYTITVLYQGKEIPLYTTADGENLVQGVTPFSVLMDASNTATDTGAAQQPTAVPKTDKPVVELYVFTYCPYGTQAEKGIIPTIKALGNKVDFKIRQIGAMHGEHEQIEAQRQLCIEKNYPTKFLDYVSAFISDSAIGACGSDATCKAPLLKAIYSKLGIDVAKIDACIPTEGLTMYNAEVSNAQKLSVSGSPTLIINGVKSSAGRDSASYLAGICSAFNTAPTTECGKQLSSTSPAAGFGTAAAAASSSASAQC
jgi:hypothetical protein